MISPRQHVSLVPDRASTQLLAHASAGKVITKQLLDGAASLLHRG